MFHLCWLIKRWWSVYYSGQYSFHGGQYFMCAISEITCDLFYSARSK